MRTSNPTPMRRASSCRRCWRRSSSGSRTLSIVLSREARADADPEARLAQLLGNLRFSKALQAFRQSGSVELGEQLLQVLPERVREGAMPADRAQRLQMQILSVLEPEDDRRQQRLYAAALHGLG